MERKELLNRLATLTVKVGANLQKGQTAIIYGQVELAEVVRLIAEQCWLAGAAEVHIFYEDEICDRLRYTHGEVDRLTKIPQWVVDRRMNYPKGEACYIYLEGDNPDIFAGLDSNKIGAAAKAKMLAMKPFHDLIDKGENQWTIVPAATKDWATKLFPGLEPTEAVDKLWEAIALTVRLDTPDPVAAWTQHSKSIADHSHFLNNSGINLLKFKNSLGTDLTVELAEGYIWCGGSSKTVTGVAFQANMPTEEVFSMPHKDKVNGKVVSSLPLIYQGMTIDNFTLTFKDGLVVDYTAETGLDALTQMLDADSGSRRLGEVALVPYSSPIRKSGILFYSTLFDENASCHLALGSAYVDTMKDGLSLSDEERAKRGFNDSISHVDFMFGTSDLSVVGVRPDGSTITIFENGEWVQ
ncbi:MAG: aminopeptidase, partial [Angelakisella sp.]